MKEKKIKWLKPRLEKLARNGTKGQCESGSGDATACCIGSSGDLFGVCDSGTCADVSI